MLTMAVFGQFLLGAGLEARILVQVIKGALSRDWRTREGEEIRKGEVSGHFCPISSLTLQGAVQRKVHLKVCLVARQGDEVSVLPTSQSWAMGHPRGCKLSSQYSVVAPIDQE